MDNDNRILALAIVVVVVLGFLGFVFGDVTGFAVRNREKVLSRMYLSSNPDILDEFSPTVDSGDFIYITVETGSSGIKDEVSFYEQVGTNPRKRAKTFLGCTGYMCRPNRVVSKKYKTSHFWDGEYCARVYDREFREDVEVCFFVK
ncbi:MAG: hypothetical protein QGF74_01505 [Candidatus Nanoarchaeia archaeon]|jgi:hypothetical protein|nr:hypothetical protein [Candidatus Nanoarchaeia archaeon]|tara:strand:- start:15024 stop:15461 length:438 start_codon:yes stop_codon:yes gene_type:complete